MKAKIVTEDLAKTIIAKHFYDAKDIRITHQQKDEVYDWTPIPFGGCRLKEIVRLHKNGVTGIRMTVDGHIGEFRMCEFEDSFTWKIGDKLTFTVWCRKRNGVVKAVSGNLAFVEMELPRRQVCYWLIESGNPVPTKVRQVIVDKIPPIWLDAIREAGQTLSPNAKSYNLGTYQTIKAVRKFRKFFNAKHGRYPTDKEIDDAIFPAGEE